MDEKHNQGYVEGIEDSSMILKAAQVSSQEITSKELSQINKLTLEPLTAEEVFTFKVAMCDNEIDRSYEVFPLKTLQGLQKLYVGKTIIKDHRRSADNQVARIYATELLQSGSKTTKTGELYTQLVARCYMLNNEANKNLISEIKAGIKKEVSVGCSVDKAVCSICGADNRKDYCKHYWGKSYDGKTCHFSLEDPKDAYELSFVAVPAQPKAATIKSYGAKFKDFDEEKLINKDKENKESEFKLRLKMLDSFLFTNNINEEEQCIMNKKMRELYSKIELKTNLVKSLIEDGENKDVDKAMQYMEEVKELEKEFKVAKSVFESSKEFNTPDDDELEKNQKESKSKDSEKEFADATRSFIRGKGLVEGVEADGGYTVPEDIMTKIQYYKDAEYSLLQDIDIEPVTTNKGARTYQKKSDVNTFVDIDENGEITKEIEAPKFERLAYTIQDRAGFMPVSNDLISDSDANIVDVVTKWLGKADVATSNKKILELVATKSAVELTDIDGIKKALNVTLGQAYKNGAKIYTNDDGLNYLDTLKDATGRPLLNPDPTSPLKLQLRCGATVLPIKVIPNKVFATTNKKIPFIIGNLYDYAKKFERQQVSIMASNVATIGTFNAFSKNMTILRAIVRDDYKVKDKDSIVNGFITVS